MLHTEPVGLAITWHAAGAVGVCGLGVGIIAGRGVDGGGPAWLWYAILITGAGGRVGAMLARDLARDRELRLLDVVRAVRLALEKDGIQWGRYLVSGANPGNLYGIDTAERLLAFKARYGFDVGRMYEDGVLAVGE